MTPQEAFEVARHRDWPAPPYVSLGRLVIDDMGNIVYEAPLEVGEPRYAGDVALRAEQGSFRAKAVADALNRGGVHAERMRRRLSR